jgi:stalled ribosome rescue protein Dom34
MSITMQKMKWNEKHSGTTKEAIRTKEIIIMTRHQDKDILVLYITYYGIEVIKN